MVLKQVPNEFWNADFFGFKIIFRTLAIHPAANDITH
jgi:hypothetical protein